MAYDVNRETYAMGRYFIWQKPWPQKTYHHAKMQAQYERELREATENQTLRGFMRRGGVKLYYFWLDLSGSTLAVRADSRCRARRATGACECRG